MFEEEEKYLDSTLEAINEEIIVTRKKISDLEKEGKSLSFEDRQR